MGDVHVRFTCRAQVRGQLGRIHTGPSSSGWHQSNCNLKQARCGASKALLGVLKSEHRWGSFFLSAKTAVHWQSPGGNDRGGLIGGGGPIGCSKKSQPVSGVQQGQPRSPSSPFVASPMTERPKCNGAQGRPDQGRIDRLAGTNVPRMADYSMQAARMCGGPG